MVIMSKIFFFFVFSRSHSKSNERAHAPSFDISRQKLGPLMGVFLFFLRIS